MDQPKPELEKISIVLLGSFSPSMFQPAWLALHELIRPEEAESAKVEIIHPEVVIVSIATVKIQMTQDKYIGSTTDPSANEFLRDLTLGTFRLLRHTPIRAMGLNWSVHFRMASEEAWHKAGHRLAPKEPWIEVLEKPGMRSLTMEGSRSDANKGKIQIRIEPSSQVQPGIFIQINDHCEIQDYKPEAGCEAIMNLLLSNWKGFLGRFQMARSLVGGFQ